MHTLIIGHRGVGKTSLLQRLQTYFPEAVCLCLDAEIEKRHGPIAQIFSQKGESRFREIERETLKELLSRFQQKVRPVYIALGAGFQGELPVDWEVLHVQRDLSVQTFLFANRPSLAEGVYYTPSERFSERSKNYESKATQEITLLEGDVSEFPEEKLFFSENIQDLGGVITLWPRQVRSKEFKYWARHRIAWGIKAFELRDDILSPEDLQRAIELVPREKLLLSFRRKQNLENSLSLLERVELLDWPVEFGEAPRDVRDRAIYSLHSEAEQFSEHLDYVQNLMSPIKWSPVIENFKDLIKAHQWFLKNPQKRSLLPRSSEGRWLWYRLWTKGQMPLQFLSEGKGSAPDQPHLLQWLSRSKNKRFAAILGSPIRHSWTPAFHKTFFQQRGLDVLPVWMSEEELDKNLLGQLQQEWGFRAFAVTSPLKQKAADILKLNEPINTLVWSAKKLRWEGFNTDLQGFEVLLSSLLESQGEGAVVWGGGGVLPILKALLPKVSLYSAQKAEPREGEASCSQPHTLIWAAGGTWPQEERWPLESWKPQRVFDLSYVPDSSGLEYALRIGAEYISGRDMFIAQAERQQEIWSKYEFK